jgi:serine-type D-Ala-D-Ala carboxypeptidase/endopeptidase
VKVKQYCVLLGAIACGLFASCNTAERNAADVTGLTLNLTGIQKDIDDVVNMQVKNGFNVGAVVGLITKGTDKVIPYGVTDLETGKVPSGDTLYEIGSVTKVFTGILLTSLVQAEKVRLDDPISMYVPELAGKEIGSITLIELATHTSGLPSVPGNLVSNTQGAPYAGYREEQLLEFLRSFDLGDHPTPFDWKNYSNLGASVLGYALTKAASKSYEELLQAFITRPLHMTHTTSVLSPVLIERYATPYNAIGEKGFRQDFGVFVAAGGILSTANDMMKFIRANLQPAKTGIAKALRLAQEIHRARGENNVGLGWHIETIGKRVIHSHAGGTGFFTSYVTFDQSRGVGYVVLTNTGSIIPCLTEIIMKDESCQPDFGVKVPAEILLSYVGKYRHESGFEIKIGVKNNFLTYEMVGREKGILTAVSDNRFTILKAAFFEFKKDASEKVSEIVLENGGAAFSLKKVAE